MNNLASTYWNLGRWQEVEELQVIVVEARKRVLGEKHPDTLLSMESLAITYRSRGRMAEAMELDDAVAAIRQNNV